MHRLSVISVELLKRLDAYVLECRWFLDSRNEYENKTFWLSLCDKKKCGFDDEKWKVIF